MGKVSNKKSELSVQEVSKGSKMAINRINVVFLRITNNTSFEVSVKERIAGDIRIPTGKEFLVITDYPFDFSATVTFNSAAPVTDYITFTINSLGDEFQTSECANNQN